LAKAEFFPAASQWRRPDPEQDQGGARSFQMFGSVIFGKSKFGQPSKEEESNPLPIEQPVCDWETLQRLTGKKKKRKVKPTEQPEVVISPPVSPAPAPRSKPNQAKQKPAQPRVDQDERDLDTVMTILELMPPDATGFELLPAGKVRFKFPPTPQARPRLAAIRAKLRRARWDLTGAATATKEE
jgi:hypothetical protein